MKKDSYLRKATFGMGFILLVMSAVMLQIPGTAGAQEEEYTLEDTVVTATKTGETDLQKTGIAVSVFNEEYLQDLGAYNLFDLENYAPSLDMNRNLRIVQPFIRGIGSRSSTNMSGDAAVAIYLDGVYLNQGRGAMVDFMDVERIEILKGPQGVLFGGNAVGGALNYIFKKPTDEFELTGTVEVGNYALRRIDARIAGPLVEGKVRASLTVMDAMHDGYVDNLSTERDLNDQNDWGARGTIQILPSDSVEITLSADYSEKEFYILGSKALYLTDRQQAALDEAVAAGYPKHYLWPEDFWTMNTNEEHLPNSYENWGVALHMDFKLPHDMTLRSITAHRNASDETIRDSDYWFHRHSYMDQDQASDQTTQEITLNGTWGKLDFLVGGYYIESYVHCFPFQFGYPEAYFPFEGSPLEGLPVILDIEFSTVKENWALFSNFTYAVTDKLNLSAGIRYSNESKEWRSAVGFYIMLPDGSRGPLLFEPVPPGDTTGPGRNGAWTVWTPRFAIEYQATEDIFIFASYAEGFKSGMLYPSNAVAGVDPVLDPESIETWELGVKTDWLNRRLRVNASLFTNDYLDRHVQALINNDFVMQNVGVTESTGAELEVIARPIQGLTLMANVTYLDTEVSDFEAIYRFDDLGMRSVDGSPFPRIPEWKFNFGANYTLTLEEAGYLTFGANIAYQDDVPMSYFPEDPYLWKPDYTLVNATIRYETQDGRWALEGYARNLFEKKYYNVLFAGTPEDDGGDATFYMPGIPRRIGVRVTYRY